MYNKIYVYTFLYITSCIVFSNINIDGKKYRTYKLQNIIYWNEYSVELLFKSKGIKHQMWQLKARRMILLYLADDIKNNIIIEYRTSSSFLTIYFCKDDFITYICNTF